MPAAPMKNANPSGPSAKQRKMFAKMGIAMPDGSYYVRNADDLGHAIMAVGRGEAAGDSGNAIRVHIMKRAAALKLSSQIPDTWNADGSLKTTVTKHSEVDSVDEFLAHFGVRGMKWGVRKDRQSGPPSADAARATALKTQVKTQGTHSLSNADLSHLVARMNLEQQYSRLSGDDVSKGEKFVKNTIKTAKIGLDAYNTATQIQKAVEGVSKKK